jgi:hypothetical protein
MIVMAQLSLMEQFAIGGILSAERNGTVSPTISYILDLSFELHSQDLDRLVRLGLATYDESHRRVSLTEKGLRVATSTPWQCLDPTPEEAAEAEKIINPLPSPPAAQHIQLDLLPKQQEG